MLTLLIMSIALLHAAPVDSNTDELLSALVRDTYPEKVQLTANQITDLLVKHYKQMETLLDQPKALKMTGERTGGINIMTVDGVSGSSNVFINGNNNAVTNNNYYVEIGSNANLDHLITLIMNLTQQDDADDDVLQMVNDVLDIAREHASEEPEETFVSSTTGMSTSVETTTTSELSTESTTTTSTSTTPEELVTSTQSSTNPTIEAIRTPEYESTSLMSLPSPVIESTSSTTTTMMSSTSKTSTGESSTSSSSTSTSTEITTTPPSSTSSANLNDATPLESEPLDVQLKLPSSVDRRCPTCVSSKSIAVCFKSQTTCSPDQVCSIELRSRNTRIESVTMGCKQRQACHTENRQNDGQCRPWMRNGPSVCRTCCNGPSCYVTLQQFENRPFRSAVSSWSKLF